MTIATRWKLLVGTVVVVLMLVLGGILLAQAQERCREWQGKVRRQVRVAAAPPPGFLHALYVRRPLGCANVLHRRY
ncbi:MAG: hypothetical protein M3P01_10195 [Actinomycetota bacterium]|nr:hypothetical protein [Actinomycetota bacterium]